MKTCSQCGASNPADTPTCSACGGSLTTEKAPPAAAKTSRRAIASLVCGMLVIFLPLAIAASEAAGLPGTISAGIFVLIPLAAITAIVLGHLASTKIRRSAGRLTGAGVSLAGLILAYIGVPLLIAAVIVPCVRRSPMALNESSAFGSLRQIDTACTEYSAKHKGYPSSLAALGSHNHGNVDHQVDVSLDPQLASGTKSGYAFVYKAFDTDSDGAFDTYTVLAAPLTPGATGIRYFFTDQTGVIRAGLNETVSANSLPIS